MNWYPSIPRYRSSWGSRCRWRNSPTECRFRCRPGRNSSSKAFRSRFPRNTDYSKNKTESNCWIPFKSRVIKIIVSNKDKSIRNWRPTRCRWAGRRRRWGDRRPTGSGRCGGCHGRGDRQWRACGEGICGGHGRRRWRGRERQRKIRGGKGGFSVVDPWEARLWVYLGRYRTKKRMEAGFSFVICAGGIISPFPSWDKGTETGETNERKHKEGRGSGINLYVTSRILCRED